jgi:hypothetical protein
MTRLLHGSDVLMLVATMSVLSIFIGAAKSEPTQDIVSIIRLTELLHDIDQNPGAAFGVAFDEVAFLTTDTIPIVPVPTTTVEVVPTTTVKVVPTTTVDEISCDRGCKDDNSGQKMDRVTDALRRLGEEWVKAVDPKRPSLVSENLNYLIMSFCVFGLAPRDGSACWEAASVIKSVQDTCERHSNPRECCAEIITYAAAMRQMRRSSDFLHHMRTCSMQSMTYSHITRFDYAMMSTTYTTIIREVAPPSTATGIFSYLSDSRFSAHAGAARPTPIDVRNWIAFLAHARPFDIIDDNANLNPDNVKYRSAVQLLAFLNECIETHYECRSFDVQRARAILLESFGQHDLAHKDWTAILEHSQDPRLLTEALHARSFLE